MLKLLSTSRHNLSFQTNIPINANILHKSGRPYNSRTFSSTSITWRTPKSEYSPKSQGHHASKSTSHPLSHSRFTHGKEPREFRKTSLTPSEEFMEMRNNSMNFARSLGKRKKEERQREGLASIKDSAANVRTPKRSSSYKALKPVPGDVFDLFNSASLQNREVLPGDFVEIRRPGKLIFAIYHRDFDQSEGRLQSTSITQGAEFFEHRTADVTFRVPGFAFIDRVVEKVGLWDVEANPENPPAGLGRFAASFGEDSKTILGVNYAKFDSIYDTFWHQRQRKSLTTLEAARYVFGKENDPNPTPLTAQQLYATHLYLTQDDSLNKFTPVTSIRWTGGFNLQPPSKVLLSTTVIDWIRKDDKRIVQFQEKVKALIEGYRNGDKTNWKDVTFTESDRTLIEFVKQTAYVGYGDVFPSPLLTYLPRLLRPTTYYDDIEGDTGFKFLKEIGVWPEWYNMEISRSPYDVYGSIKTERDILKNVQSQNPELLHSGDNTQHLMSAEDVTDSANGHTPESEPAFSNQLKEASPISSSPLVLQNPLEFYKRDICESIRHDFGHQPVYAIDDPSASELDDAFSVEPVPVTTLTPIPSTWVHVHVADPTSILPPGHKVSQLAASRIQTVYLPERSWPMIPRELTEGTLSLKNDGQPKNVMTFSARINNETAEILESKIRPGIVRNLITLNYDDVDEILSWDRIQGGKEEGLRVQKSAMRMPENSILERNYYRSTFGSLDLNDKPLVRALQDLQVIAQSHQDSRVRSGAFGFHMGKPLVELTPYPIIPIPNYGWEKPIDYSQWQEPEITCRLDPSLSSPSRIMVAEYMILAGRIASMFTKENNIPVLYRNQSLPNEKYRDMFNQKIRELTNKTTGLVGLIDMLPLKPYIPGAEISSIPLGHFSLGLSAGYCKVTSPLRRYSDMVCHWQIKSALLGQESPFSLKELDMMASMIRERERILGMLESRSVKFWLYEMIRRKTELGTPIVFDGYYLNPTSDGYNGMSSQLGFQSVVKAELEEIKGLGVGDKVSFEAVASNPQRPFLLLKHISPKV